MATTTSDSLSELERRAETTRAELAQTVDALHSRVSPGAIKADVKSYIRDNPLQAAAIAVGAAYPVWRMIGAIPAPVLLIGAGLAMARRPSAPGTGAGTGMMSTLKDKASGVTAQISDKAHDAVDRVRDMAADTKAQASERLSDTRDAAAETLHRVSDRASEGYATARDTLADAIDRYPLLAGAAALAAGGILASAVPVSRQESRLMGETAGDIRRRSQDLARQGLRQAENMARQVYDTASEEVSEQGLTPDAARRTARAAVETARGAMEKATTGGSDRS